MDGFVLDFFIEQSTFLQMKGTKHVIVKYADQGTTVFCPVLACAGYLGDPFQKRASLMVLCIAFPCISTPSW